ncbi:MAG: hypothetical protein ACFBWO_01295 [Paracoccaceae bacterium]
MADAEPHPPADPGKSEAPDAAAYYLARAIEAVDAAFGRGYARENLGLVAAMVQASAIESAVNAGIETRDRINETVERSVRETNATLLKLKPKLF